MNWSAAGWLAELAGRNKKAGGDMISEVFKFDDNDTVLVFDENGEQIPEFQGKYEDVRVKILARAPKEATFYHGTWPQGRKLVSRKEW